MPKVRVIQATKGTLADKLPVAAYCRVSSNSEDQRHSFIAQVKEYTARIEENDKWELAGIYADQGITGTSATKRPEFQRLIEDCRQGKVKRILTKSISRFARNTQECLEYVRELKILGVSVYFEKEGLDTADIAGELLISVFGSLAQEESTSLSDNMRWSYEKRMQEGNFITCRAPYGYKIDKHDLVICDEQASTIRLIFDLYLNGYGEKQIVEELNTARIDPPAGTKWYKSAVHYILTNERYCGNALLQKFITLHRVTHIRKRNYGEQPQYYIENSHPPIISAEVFEKAVRLRQSRAQDKPLLYTCGDNLLRKRIICSECGGLFTRRQRRSGLVCWVCRRHEESKASCPTPPIQEKAVEVAFESMVSTLTASINTLLLPMANQLRRLQERSILGNEDINALNQQILSFTDQLHAVSKLYNLDVLDVATYREKSNAMNAQLDEAQRKRKLLIDGTTKDDMLDKTEELISVLQDAVQSPASLVAGGFFEQIVDKVLVDRNKKIVFRLINGLELTGVEGNKDGEE